LVEHLGARSTISSPINLISEADPLKNQHPASSFPVVKDQTWTSLARSNR